MMDNCFLSVVIPVTRKESAVELLQSINLSTGVEFVFEVVLLVSDEIHLKKEDYFYDVKVIITEEKFSPAVGRNLGVEASSGKYILFVDDDCIADTDLLKNWFLYIKENNPQIAAGCVVPRDTVSMVQRFCVFQGIVCVSSEADFSGYLLCANALFKREVFDSLRGFDEVFKFAGGEDVDISLRAKALGFDVLFASQPLVYHKHSDSWFYWIRKCFDYGKSFRLVMAVNDNTSVLIDNKSYDFNKVFSFLKIPFKILNNLKGYDRKRQKIGDIFLFPFLSYFFNVVFRIGMFFK